MEFASMSVVFIKDALSVDIKAIIVCQAALKTNYLKFCSSKTLFFQRMLHHIA